MKNSQGFTLIELVVVITILGILAAVALPRFTNLQKDARIAKVRAVEGAMNSSMSIVKGSAIARAGQGAIDGCTTTLSAVGVIGGNVALEGSTLGLPVCVTVGPGGYPTDALGGIVKAALTVNAAAPNKTPTVAELNVQGYGYTAAAGITVIGGPAAATCGVPYDATTTPPTVGPIVTTGC